jgi:predicted enzyme related to lactoylglutathione lyase
MTHIDETLPGRATWIDLGSPDPAASAAFYSGLFGWQVLDLGAEAGHYHMAQVDGRFVAGIGQQQNPGPPYWTTYFAVESADDAAAKITAAGGTLIVPPMDVMDSGRMAVAFDPTGAAFSVWQPLNHKGIGVHSVLGTRCWSELMTRDVARASKFYAAVFGWEVEHVTEMHYTMFKIGEEQIGGMLTIDENFPADMPAAWAVYFYTEDIEGTVAKAGALGASVMMPPTPIEGVGRFAVLADPQGAVFNLLEPGT